MATIAQGSKQVRALELAMGGKIPKGLLKRPKAALERHIEDNSRRTRALRTQVQALLMKARAPLDEQMRKDPRTAELAKGMRTLLPRLRPKRRTIGASKIEPRIETGSTIVVKVAPYDDHGRNDSGDGTGRSWVRDGYYETAVDGNGAAWAGLAMNFFATDDNPFQRFAAFVEYEYYWLDWSSLAAAHNDAATYIWVWGFTENDWVAKSPALDPSWSDGTSWYEEHASGGDGYIQGIHNYEIGWPAFKGSWYQAWVWSTASCDCDGTFSWASMNQVMHPRFVVFGGSF